MRSKFTTELSDLINKHSIENQSNTPDYILAEYLISCLRAFENAVNERSDWFSEAEFDDGEIITDRETNCVEKLD